MAMGEQAWQAVVMQGAAPMRYRWLREGLRIHTPTAHTATLQLPSLNPADAGMFQCRVTNADGTALSSPALVVVNPAAPWRPEPLVIEEPAPVRQRSLQPEPAEAAPAFLRPQADETGSTSDDVTQADVSGPATVGPESLPDEGAQDMSESNSEAEAPAAVPEDLLADALDIKASPEGSLVEEMPAEPAGPSDEGTVIAAEAEPVADSPSSSASEAGYASQLF